MLKIMMVTALVLLSAQADRIKSTTVACPSVETLQTLEKSRADFKDKNLFLMKKGCLVLTPGDKIHVLTPTAACCGRYERISIDATNDIMYVDKSAVYVEQPGDKNILRF